MPGTTIQGLKTQHGPALQVGLAIIALVLAVSACSRESQVLVVQPTVLNVDLSRLPKEYWAHQWQPGDEVIVVPDLRRDYYQVAPAVEVIPETEADLLLNDPESAALPGGDETEPVASGIASLQIQEQLSFPGIPATGADVPDPVGDVGKSHYVQMVNSAIWIFDRQGQPLIVAPRTSSLWKDHPDNPCAADDRFDPVVRYDARADRWLLSQWTPPANGKNAHLCVAVSKTADPVTGGWYGYAIPAQDLQTQLDFVPDYPKLTIWTDSFLLTTQRGYNLGDQDVWAFNREAMLAGQDITPVRIHVPPPGQVPPPTLFLMPADFDGEPPAAGTPGVFARIVDGERFGGEDRIEIFALDINWNDPQATSLSDLAMLPTEPFRTDFCGKDPRAACIPQKGTNQLLEVSPSHLMWRLQYRNFGSHQSLLLSHTIGNGDTSRAAIRWYELRKSGTESWKIFQHGTLADDELNLWMGSIAMNELGDVALGYNTSSANEHPTIRLAGRRIGDPLGLMPQAGYIAVAGSGSQTHFNSRWGDYTSMDADPFDACTFWYTGQYYETFSEAGWRTQIVSFKLAGCL